MKYKTEEFSVLFFCCDKTLLGDYKINKVQSIRNWYYHQEVLDKILGIKLLLGNINNNCSNGEKKMSSDINW